MRDAVNQNKKTRQIDEVGVENPGIKSKTVDLIGQQQTIYLVIGVGLVEKGIPVYGIDGVIERLIGEINDHVLYNEDMNQYYYRPPLNGGIARAARGEVYVEDRLSGPAIALRFLGQKGADSLFDRGTIENARSQEPRAIREVLEKIGKLAAKGDRSAKDFICMIGREMGHVIRVFTQAYPERGFSRKIVLVGGVSENFARDVPGDPLLCEIRREAGIESIFRSEMGYQERELLAFKP